MPALNYPLFALNIKGKGYVCVPRSMPGEQTKINAIIICTHRAIARTCIEDMELDAALVPISSSENFRRFLKDNSGHASAIAFDPDVDVRNHRINMKGFGRIAEVLEALPEPLFVWSYPLFVVQTGTNQYAAFQGTSRRNGVTKLGVAIFTDEDLAERYIAQRKGGGTTEPLESARAFSRFLRSQQAKFVSFDPSKAADGMSSKFVVEVSALLKQLPR